MVGMIGELKEQRVEEGQKMIVLMHVCAEPAIVLQIELCTF